MVTELSIRHVKRSEVDPVRWDACIHAASNGSPYALHDYLDALTPDWEALVTADYSFVMPLPVRKKWNIRYLYQPFLVPHLGVYGKMPNESVLQAFLEAIPKNIRWIDLTLNPGSIPETGAYNIHYRTNYILPLSPDYEALRAGYRENHRRNLRRAEQSGFQIIRHYAVREIFELAETYLGPRGHFPLHQKETRIEWAERWVRAGRAETYGVVMGGRLLAAAFFLLHRDRAYYLIVGNHPDGKTLGASHTLIDAFIRDHAGQPITLDFEGSDVPSLAYFYQGFGASEERFGWIRINRLPKWIAWLKPRY